MRDLSALTAADFESAVGTEFEVARGDAESVALRLVRVTVVGERPGHRTPFALEFIGPRLPVLDQVIHRMTHPDMGEFELFVGPVVSEADGTTYEAVFN